MFNRHKTHSTVKPSRQKQCDMDGYSMLHNIWNCSDALGLLNTITKEKWTVDIKLISCFNTKNTPASSQVGLSYVILNVTRFCLTFSKLILVSDWGLKNKFSFFTPLSADYDVEKWGEEKLWN